MQFVAKKLDKRLLDLGATAIVEKGLGDDQHPAGYDFIMCCGFPLCIHLTIVLSMALFQILLWCDLNFFSLLLQFSWIKT